MPRDGADELSSLEVCLSLRFTAMKVFGSLTLYMMISKKSRVSSTSLTCQTSPLASQSPPSNLDGLLGFDVGCSQWSAENRVARQAGRRYDIQG